MVAVFHINELCSNANIVARLSDAAFENCCHIELLTYDAQIFVLVLECKRRSTPGNPEVLDACQHVEQFFGQPVGKIFVLGIRAHVDEWQYCNRHRYGWQSGVIHYS